MTLWLPISLGEVLRTAMKPWTVYFGLWWFAEPLSVHLAWEYISKPTTTRFSVRGLKGMYSNHLRRPLYQEDLQHWWKSGVTLSNAFTWRNYLWHSESIFYAYLQKWRKNRLLTSHYSQNFPGSRLDKTRHLVRLLVVKYWWCDPQLLNKKNIVSYLERQENITILEASLMLWVFK